MATKIIDKNSISLGLAELYLSDSTTYIATTTQALTSANYFCGLVNIALDINSTYLKQYTTVDDVRKLSDVLKSSVSININVTALEMNKTVLNKALGGSGAEADIFGTLQMAPKKLRAELVFTYPNKINQMILIFPEVVETLDNKLLQFNAEEPMTVDCVFSVLRTTNTNWNTYKLGRAIFI